MMSFQSSELTELPVSENSQLFAQRAHSASTARAQRTVRLLSHAQKLANHVGSDCKSPRWDRVSYSPQGRAPTRSPGGTGPVLWIVRITAGARYTLFFGGIHTRYTLQMPGIHM